MTRLVVESLLGAVLSISADLPGTYDAAGYAGSPSINWTPVGQIEDYGSHGVTATVTKFIPVDTGVVAKAKGSKDYGTMSLMLADLQSDAGQVIVAAAAESQNHYSVRIVYPDGEIHYLDVLVAKRINQDGKADSIRMLAVDLELCRKPVVVAAP